MDTDHSADLHRANPHSADLSQADRRVLRLMRLLTHVNAGAVLALCFWLAWSAWQAGEPAVAPRLTPASQQGCGCALTQAPASAGALRLAAHHGHSFTH